MKQCKGCGAYLQSESKDLPGYTPKEDAVYCQRCFRIQHYDDVTVSYSTKMDTTQILKTIADMDALVLWVVDLFDFEASMIEGMNRHCAGKDIVMVVTKRDLLPDTLSEGKLTDFLFSRLKEYGIVVKGIVVTGRQGKDGIGELIRAIELYARNKEIVVMGTANAGKSSILNTLLRLDQGLTMSRYPGTTLGFTKLEWNGYTIYDSPGIHKYDSAIFLLEDHELKYVIPSSTLRPVVYQLYGDQSLALGGLMRVDAVNCRDNASMTVYASRRLPLHRGKVENADNLWESHYNELLSPTIDRYPDFVKERIYTKGRATDICMYGVGWVCFKGSCDYIDIRYPKGVKVKVRKAML